MSPDPNPIDLEHLLRFCRDTYAHAMTLQELMLLPESERTEGKYDLLRERNNQTAEQEFDLLFRALHDPRGFADALRAFLDTHPKTGQVQ
jgi:hypothetical protein